MERKNMMNVNTEGTNCMLNIVDIATVKPTIEKDRMCGVPLRVRAPSNVRKVNFTETKQVNN
ncbi:MAG: hypothetical protein WC938_01710 [Candidatus Paceibacterota bacterium]|jgi:hypothetical protein